MVDLKTNNQGLTYVLADFAKTQNGGKSVKLSTKQWQSVMKVVSDINSKRSPENLIFTGGDNLLGDVSKNFVVKADTIRLSQEEVSRILKEMGVETKSQPENSEIPEDEPIRGFAVEIQPTPLNELYGLAKSSYRMSEYELDKPIKLEMNNSVAQEVKTIRTPGVWANSDTESSKAYSADSGQNEGVRVSFGKNEQSINSSYVENNPLEEFRFKFPDIAEAVEATAKENSTSQVFANAKESVSVQPPFEIKTRKPGIHGGGTKTISKEFHDKILKFCEEFGCEYDDLIAVMNFEGKMNPQEGSDNLRKKPVGLIQFTNRSIQGLNETYGLKLNKEIISKMSAEEQFELVEQYFKMARRQCARLRNKSKLDAADLYSLTILPARAGRDILCERGERSSSGKLLNYYESNAGIDVGKDDVITRADINAKLDQFRINVKVV